MVDFKSEATVGMPAANLQRILILEKKEFTIEAMEAYYKVQAQTRATTDISIVKSRLLTFFLEVRAMFKRSKTAEEHDEVFKGIKTLRTIEEAEELFNIVDDFLDEKRVIRVDLRREYDTTSGEDEAAEYGL